MGRKSRKKSAGRRKIVRPDEVFSFGPLIFERYGRFIRFSNRSTPEEHAAFLERSKEVHAEVLSSLASEVNVLQRLVGCYDPLAIMERAAYEFLPLGLKYQSESEFSDEESLYLPTLEYLQYLIARTEPATQGEKPSEDEWEELWAKALDVMKLTKAYLMTRPTLENPPSETDEWRFFLDGQRLGIRGRRYTFFTKDSWGFSFGPYEQEIEALYGAKLEDLVNGLQQIQSYQATGVLDRHREVFNLYQTALAKLQTEIYLAKEPPIRDAIEREGATFATDEKFAALREELGEKIVLTFTPALFDITDLTSLPSPFLSLLSVRPGESILTTLTGPGHDDLSPLSTSVLHYKPFLEVEGRFYQFYHSGFEDRIPEIVESDLFIRMPERVPQMLRRRAAKLEEEVMDVVAQLLRPDFAHHSVHYPNPDDDGNLAELDLLIGLDDVLFLIEVKAGEFSAPASRGAPKSVEKELSDLIVAAHRQAKRAERFIRSAEEVTFLDETGTNNIQRIRWREFRRIYRVVVTRENLGWVGATVGMLSALDPSISEAPPWQISLDDLWVIRELFMGEEIRFVHYLEQRLAASLEPVLRQCDEIEHVGLYNKLNQYHSSLEGMADRISFDASFMLDIDHYFSQKVAGGSPKTPGQEVPEELSEFLRALRCSGLRGRFEVGCFILDIDREGRHKISTALKSLRSARSEGRMRSCRFPVATRRSGITVTYAQDRALTGELRRSAVHMTQGGSDRWLVVQLAQNHAYAISRIEVIVPGQFSDAELAADRSRFEKATQRRIEDERPGRNHLCPCGSGKKFKKCHGSTRRRS